MRRQVGVFVAACFYYSGLVKLARWWTQRSGPRLTILTYHRASGGGDLRHHLLYLRRHYRSPSFPSRATWRAVITSGGERVNGLHSIRRWTR